MQVTVYASLVGGHILVNTVIQWKLKCTQLKFSYLHRGTGWVVVRKMVEE